VVFTARRFDTGGEESIDVRVSGERRPDEGSEKQEDEQPAPNQADQSTPLSGPRFIVEG
jgi:hypothetical protein